MASPPDKRQAEASFGLRWVVRLAALACLAPPWVKYKISLSDPCGAAPVFWLALSIVGTVVYFFLISQTGFRGGPNKNGLAHAVQTGVTCSGIAALGAIFAFASEQVVGGLLWALYGLANGALAISAIKTYHSTEPATSSWKIMRKKLAVFLIPLFLGLLGLAAMLGEANPWEGQAVRNNGSAVGALRLINRAEGQYASMYDQGFSTSLRALGSSSAHVRPDSSAAGLIEDSLANGTRGAYTFSYTPGPPDSTGRIRSYTISARCLCACDHDLFCARSNNYFTDDSGVIRQTEEDRNATAKDTPIVR